MSRSNIAELIRAALPLLPLDGQPNAPMSADAMIGADTTGTLGSRYQVYRAVAEIGRLAAANPPGAPGKPPWSLVSLPGITGGYMWTRDQETARKYGHWSLAAANTRFQRWWKRSGEGWVERIPNPRQRSVIRKQFEAALASVDWALESQTV